MIQPVNKLKTNGEVCPNQEFRGISDAGKANKIGLLNIFLQLWGPI